MGRESSLWKTLKKRMKGKWEAERIECVSGLGIPDVYYSLKVGESHTASGWIELKYLKEWPKNDETKIRIGHFTEPQKNFMRRHGKNGAKVFLLIQIDRDYMLMEWQHAIDIENMVKDEVFLWAEKHWHGSIVPEDLVYFLS